MDDPANPFAPPDRLHPEQHHYPPPRRPSPILQAPRRRSSDGHSVLRPGTPPINTHFAPPRRPSHPDDAPPVARTPRRVQWTKDHVIDLPTEDHNPDLAHVNEALEEFKSSHDVPPAMTKSSLHSSDDYDYRLDTDPKSDNDNDEETGLTRGDKESDTLHKILQNQAADEVTGYVQLGETDGLPSHADAVEEGIKEASNMVHPGRFTQLRRRMRTSTARKRRAAAAAARTAVPADDPEKAVGGVNENADTTVAVKPAEEVTVVSANPKLNYPPGMDLPHMTGGASVLSTLLALYKEENRGDSSALTSAATTPQSSRPPSIASSDEEIRGRKSRSRSPHKRHFWQHRGKTPPNSVSQSGRRSESPGMEDKRTRSHSSIADRTPEERPSLFDSAVRAVQNMRDDRPKSARSSAGVFGALIQSSSAMASAAAPTSATIIPAAKRHGYHINRYEIPSDDPTPPERIRPLSRPNSVVGISGMRAQSTSPKGDRSGSPFGGRAHRRSDSAGAVPRRAASAVGISALHDEVGTHSATPSLYEHESSDNLIVMKKKTKRPTPVAIRAVKGAESWLRSDSTVNLTEDERRHKEHKELLKELEAEKRKQQEAEKRRRKRAKEARKKKEVFIIQHVAAIIQRQHFILKLARALMMFGAPSHRLETQIQATAKVLDISAQVVYLPGIMLISFADDGTHTSETKFLKQTTGLELGKLVLVHNLYWEVVHDRMSVEVANKELDRLMTMLPCYNWWQNIIVAGFCSALISIPSYYGSFIDALMASALGMLLMIVQMFAARNDLFSGVFEIAISTLISILAAALSSTHRFCYTALVSGGIVLVLPGYIVLTGALEIASRNIVAGAVRMGYSVIYSLFLGFGISMGAEVYIKIRGEAVANATDNTCSRTHYPGAPWYQTTPTGYWYYLCVPAFAFVLSMNCQQPIRSKEMPVMVAIASAGWVVNRFAGLYAFAGRSDIVSACGAFTVGILGNLYGRFFSNGASFPVMVPAILMQLPSGLKEGGLFNFAANTSNGAFAQYSNGFSVAAQLISVAIGLTIGLFCAAVITHPLGGSRRRGAGIFSF